MHGYVHGQRGTGRPRKRCTEMIQKDGEAMETTIQDAINRAMDREKWRKSTMELPLRAFASSRHLSQVKFSANGKISLFEK